MLVLAGTDHLATAPRPPDAVLAWGRDVLDPALHAAVGTLPRGARRVAEFQFGWCDESGSRAAYAGRRALHPTLALLAAESAGAEHDAALPAAVAVELIHGFVELHDDVIAGGALRAQPPTACSVFGIGPVILAGSALQTLAFDTLAAADHARARDGMRMLSTTVHALLDGPMTGLAFERPDALGEAERRAAASARTTALLGCASALGELFAGGAGTSTNGRATHELQALTALDQEPVPVGQTRATDEERP